MVVSEPAGLLGWGPFALSRRPRSRSLPRGHHSPPPCRDGVPGDPAAQFPRGGGNPYSRASKPFPSHRSSLLHGCVRASVTPSLDQGSESEKQNAHFTLSMCFQSSPEDLRPTPCDHRCEVAQCGLIHTAASSLGGGLSPSTMLAPFSPIMIDGALVLPLIKSGMIEASAGNDAGQSALAADLMRTTIAECIWLGRSRRRHSRIECWVASAARSLGWQERRSFCPNLTHR